VASGAATVYTPCINLYTRFKHRMSDRMNIPDAARHLGISEGALRQRINRDTIEHEKDADGRVYVFIPRAHDQPHMVQGDAGVIEILKDQVEYLRQQLEQEREANRENRRLLALQLEHMRALEPPRESSPEPRESATERSEGVSSTNMPSSSQEPTSREEPDRRSWWRRWFEG
jgi:hypothetical protein